MNDMSLKNVTKGKLERPFRILLYGCEGVGKSTWAADTPAPIFLGAEEGTSQLDVTRFPEPKTWESALEAFEILRKEKHGYKSLVIDTIDWLEPVCWDYVCRKGNKSSVEEFGYGKGYVAALDQWRVMLAKLDMLKNETGMNIIMLAHSHIRTFKNPEGDDYDRYELKLHIKASGLVKEWVDALLFANYETFTHDKDGRTKGIASGSRILHSERRAAFDAKNRYGLPEKFPLSWEEFASHAKKAEPITVPALNSEIDQLMLTLSEPNQAKAQEAIKRAKGNALKLNRLVDWMRGCAA